MVVLCRSVFTVLPTAVLPPARGSLAQCARSSATGGVSAQASENAGTMARLLSPSRDRAVCGSTAATAHERGLASGHTADDCSGWKTVRLFYAAALPRSRDE